MTTQADERAARPVRRTIRKTIRQRIDDQIRRATFQPWVAPRQCVHQAEDFAIPDAPAVCAGCVRDSTTPVKLRMCLTCGSVGCCDTSAGRHAMGHFAQTGHPVMRSIELGDPWGSCYPDEAYLNLDG
jgi:uncharacterized UBP type Zn finger protein